MGRPAPELDATPFINFLSFTLCMLLREALPQLKRLNPCATQAANLLSALRCALLMLPERFTTGVSQDWVVF